MSESDVDPQSVGRSAALRLLSRITVAAVRWPFRFLLLAALVTGVAVLLAKQLEVKSSFAELLPDDVPSVAQIKELSQRVGGDGNVLVNIQSMTGPGGLAKAQALAPRLVKELLAIGPDHVRSIEWNMAPIRDWYMRNWPLFATLEELTEARDALRAGIRRRIAAANPLAVDLEEEDPEEATAAAPPAEVGRERVRKLLDPAEPSPREQIAGRFAEYPGGFMVHPDRTSVTLVLRPAGAGLDVAQSEDLLARIHAVVGKLRPELDREQLRVGIAGTVPLFIAEYEAIVGDVAWIAVLCLSVVLGSMLLFFRNLRSVLTLGIVVIVAVLVTFGITELVIGHLNTQTAFLHSIVMGNGINYGVIYLARVNQLRRQGATLTEACVEGANTTATGTLLASTTTSVSFAVLIVAANRGFSHFGFIGGLGMLLCWASTFLLVPALLAAYEKIRPGRAIPGAEREITRFVPVLNRIFARPFLISGIVGVLTAAAAAAFIAHLPNAMERNFSNLGNELRGEKVAALQREHGRAQSSLGRSIAGSIALLDSREQADQFCEQIRERMKQPRYAEVIDGCETISSVVPRQQREKLALIREVAAVLNDRLLRRLPGPQAERLREIRSDLEHQRPVTAEEAPPTLMERFRERDGALGRLAVVTARPDARIELAPRLEAFVEGARNVPVEGKTAAATGENAILHDLLENIEREGPRATMLSFVGVCLVLLLAQRRPRTSAMVISSLAVGVTLMGGIAGASVLLSDHVSWIRGLRINFFNFIAYPITFGIAVDYGANIASRVHERAGDVTGSLAEVGPAVAFCSWTTIIGYGSLLPSLNRALRSFGWYAILGELTALFAGMLLLPALMLVFGRRPRE